MAVSAVAGQAPVRAHDPRGLRRLALAALGVIYGDGLITPAVSVMSAIEGLEAATPALAPLCCRSRSVCRWRCSWSRAVARPAWALGSGRR